MYLNKIRTYANGDLRIFLPNELGSGTSAYGFSNIIRAEKCESHPLTKFLKIQEFQMTKTRPLGSLIVVTGFPATGTGKTTVAACALPILPNAARLITCTTRPMRDNEVDGRDYHFLSKEAFQAKIDSGDFLEYDQHYLHWYGTRRCDVDAMQSAHDVVMLVTDLAGAATFKSLYPDACFVAITASTKNVSLFMKGRGDSPEKIAKRITRTQLTKEKRAFKAIAFDVVIENKPGMLNTVIVQFVDMVEHYRNKSAT